VHSIGQQAESETTCCKLLADTLRFCLVANCSRFLRCKRFVS